MTHGKVSQEGQAEGFPDEVALQQVCNGLVAVELSIAYPRFSQQPVPLRVIWQEDGTIRSRGLAELGVGEGGSMREETSTGGDKAVLCTCSKHAHRPQIHI